MSKLPFRLSLRAENLLATVYTTKFVCSLSVNVQYCQITKPCLCGNQVRNQVFLRGGVIQGGDGPNEARGVSL